MQITIITATTAAEFVLYVSDGFFYAFYACDKCQDQLDQNQGIVVVFRRCCLSSAIFVVVFSVHAYF